jgi:hypothetical protein
VRHKACLVILLAMICNGCSTFHCGGAGDGHSQSGGCSAGTKF